VRNFEKVLVGLLNMKEFILDSKCYLSRIIHGMYICIHSRPSMYVQYIGTYTWQQVWNIYMYVHKEMNFEKRTYLSRLLNAVKRTRSVAHMLVLGAFPQEQHSLGSWVKSEKQSILLINQDKDFLGFGECFWTGMRCDMKQIAEHHRQKQNPKNPIRLLP
jgi:hypothetical protein